VHNIVFSICIANRIHIIMLQVMVEMMFIVHIVIGDCRVVADMTAAVNASVLASVSDFYTYDYMV
jgi:hypothetical protein